MNRINKSIFLSAANQILEFGGIVSTSNTYDVNDDSNLVEIVTEMPILWSMGLNDTED
jgi:hypothetical protein